MGREPTITVPARLGAGFTHSFEEVLVHVAPQQHEQMIEHALDILKFINVHVVADNEMVGLAVRQPGRPEYDLPFKITQKGYDLHPSYTRTTGMVTHSGGLVMGKGPYYMSEIDHHSKFPHTILTSVGEITPDQEAMPENTVRVGIIAGMKINGSFDEIKKELFDPNMLYLLREGLLEDQQRPKKISSFVRIFELPERKK
jgi:hypothetical protein